MASVTARRADKAAVVEMKGGMGIGAHTAEMVERCLRQAFDGVPVGLGILSGGPDRCGQFLDVNAAMAELMGCRPAELLGRSLVDQLRPDDRLRYEEFISRLLATHQPGEAEFYAGPETPGPNRRLSVSASLVRDTRGGPSQIVIIVEDVTRRRDAEGRLIHFALHDGVTGLPNRLLFTDRLGQALARSGRGRVAVILLDLDRFALVNEALGHDVGDRVLSEVAKRLQSVSGPGTGLARLGSDEFLVLLEGFSDDDDAVAVAERMERAIAEPFHVAGRELFLAASIGIAVAPPSEAGPLDNPEGLLAGAKTAMHRGKVAKIGGPALFQESMRPGPLSRLDIGSRLQRAVERDELRAVYQPLYSLITGRIVGAEALVRWHHPEWGVVAPLDFLSVAEETGLIVPIGTFVLESACAQARSWQRAGNDMTVGVNVSARELADPGLTDRVMSALRRNHLTPRHLCLEITESILVESDSCAGATAQALRELGVSLAIDDFGTGYSSLAYVKRFPVDTIKVDRSFVDGIDHDGREAAIVERIADLAHALDMNCVAEGVESRAQLERLRQLGCDVAQGFLLGRPVDPGTLSARLDGRQRARAGAGPASGPAAGPKVGAGVGSAAQPAQSFGKPGV